MKPILFNTEMVRAILDGRKTVTRRPCKVVPYDCKEETGGIFGICEPTHNMFLSDEESLRNWLLRLCRYKVGDILYVRETFIFDDYEGFVDFRADFTEPEARTLTWQPSIHMPKEIARIFLRVTGVRVERLMDITEAGARAEGFSGIDGFQPATKTFFDTWRAIYGDDVLWVWVIEFERCEKEADR